MFSFCDLTLQKIFSLVIKFYMHPSFVYFSPYIKPPNIKQTCRGSFDTLSTIHVSKFTVLLALPRRVLRSVGRQRRRKDVDV